MRPGKGLRGWCRLRAAGGGDRGAAGDGRLHRDRLHRDRLHDDGLVRHEEGEAGQVGLLESLRHLRERAVRNLERGVRAVVAEVDPAGHVGIGAGRAVGGELGAGRLLQVPEDPARQARRQGLGERGLDGGLAHRDDVGEADAVGRERARERVNEHASHVERGGHRAGVLPARAAEGGQHVPGHVVAALHRDLLDRVRHVLHRDLEEARGDLRRAAAVSGHRGDLAGQLGELCPCRVRVERLVAGRAEHLREVRRLYPAEQDVGVGHGQRAAVTVAGGSRRRARGVRADLVTAVVEVQHRTAAGRDRVDGQHRRAQPYPGHLGLVLPLELSREVRDVGGRAAHVESDHPVEARRARGAGHADDAAGRAGQDRVLAAERRGLGQPAVGLHEQHPDAGEFGGHLIHVAAQHRGQVGVDHGRVAPGDQPHQRADLM